MVHYMMPFAILLLYANFAGIDRRILLAARSLGARPATVFLRVFLPISAPGVAVATLFVLHLLARLPSSPPPCSARAGR